MGHTHITTMWNNTDIPLAYLFTFRCYGTWLHGDERGSIDRFHNQYKSPYIPPNKRWQGYNTRSLKREPVTLGEDQQRSVEQSIRETCELRQWLLRALNVRTNHVHVVASIGEARPESALNAFKANATRQMRQDGRWPSAASPWADRGSNRYLWNERSVSRALDYVIKGQDGEIPDLDAE
jgi:REP element-mobilizing transposase RayT